MQRLTPRVGCRPILHIKRYVIFFEKKNAACKQTFTIETTKGGLIRQVAVTFGIIKVHSHQSNVNAIAKRSLDVLR